MVSVLAPWGHRPWHGAAGSPRTLQTPRTTGSWSQALWGAGRSLSRPSSSRGEAEMCQGVQWGAGTLYPQARAGHTLVPQLITLYPRVRAGHTLHFQEQVGKPWVAGSMQEVW